MGWVIGISVFAIVLGVFQLVAGDLVWKVDKAWKELEGIPSERTDGYEAGRVLRGICFILIGLVILLVTWIAYPRT